MEQRIFEPFGKVSSLTIGGGGLGQVWGSTTREEAIATVQLALEKGFEDHLVYEMPANNLSIVYFKK